MLRFAIKNLVYEITDFIPGEWLALRQLKFIEFKEDYLLNGGKTQSHHRAAVKVVDWWDSYVDGKTNELLKLVFPQEAFYISKEAYLKWMNIK